MWVHPFFRSRSGFTLSACARWLRDGETLPTAPPYSSCVEKPAAIDIGTHGPLEYVSGAASFGEAASASVSWLAKNHWPCISWTVVRGLSCLKGWSTQK